MVEPLLTVAAVAQELGVSERWVHERIRAGELPGLRSVGRGYRIRRESLDAFLRDREVQTGPTPTRLPQARSRSTKSPLAAPFASASEARTTLLGDKRGKKP
jgi:excisionase family DNA binding protein